jgi:hypothetical protein
MYLHSPQVQRSDAHTHCIAPQAQRRTTPLPNEIGKTICSSQLEEYITGTTTLLFENALTNVSRAIEVLS